MSTETAGTSRTLVGIVTFNPEGDEFANCLNSARAECSDILVYDNGSALIDPIERACADTGTTLLRGDENRGVAYALNRLMEESAKRGAEYALLLDQDSIVLPGTVRSLVAEAKSLKPALVVSHILERATGTGTSRAGDINYAITAGTLLPVRTWRDLGGFDEALFVDFVDFDLCLRIRDSGGTIRRAPDARITQTIGRLEKRFLGNIYNYSSARLLHMSGDMIYFARKHRRAAAALKPPRTSVVGVLLVLARKSALIALYEPQKARKLLAIARGLRRGLRRAVVPTGETRSQAL